jgi:hypothetical protein
VRDFLATPAGAKSRSSGGCPKLFCLLRAFYFDAPRQCALLVLGLAARPLRELWKANGLLRRSGVRKPAPEILPQ